MMRALILAAALAATGQVQAQTALSHTTTGSVDLDRAVALCDAHVSPALTHPSGNTPSWQTGYEACATVMGQWSAAMANKAAQDQAWLAQFAATGK